MIEMFAWKAREFQNFEKTNDWFWATGLIALVGAVLAVWRGSVSFGILILLSGFVLIIFGNVKHPDHSVLINSDGLMIDENKFLWKDVTGFAIIEDPENAYNKKVIFETTRPIAPKISLPIDRSSVNPDTLKSFLLLHSTEKELKESVVKAIAEKVRF
jgi:hypothetical protein